MATTPHSSLNLSNMGSLCGKLLFEGVVEDVLESGDIPRAERVRALADFNPLLYCDANYRRGDSVPRRDFLHALGILCGKKHSRRAFVEAQNLRPQIAIQVDLRADSRLPERAFRERHGQPAIAQIVSRFGQALGNNFTDGRL